MTSPPFFDGHNDTVLKILMGKASVADIVQGYGAGHIDLPRARAGGFGGGFFAIFTPSPSNPSDRMEQLNQDEYDLPLPPMLDHADALAFVKRGFETFNDLESAGAITICRSVGEIALALKGERMAAIIHIEGAEAIGPDLDELEEFYTLGLRSLGPVWSRPTIFGEGVPFRYPSTGDIGGGLTDAGKRLVRECNRLGIMIDLSHLNEKGMDDVAALSDAPLVATHSNAYAICPHARNLTDRQLQQIADSDGMVGINLASGFLRPDGKMKSDFPLDVLLRHLDHLVKILGEDRVGLGTDFDGALVPKDIKDCAGLPNLRAALADHGVGDALMTKFTHGNWLRVLRKTWGE
ncbi:peptidase M19 [Oceanicola sp. 22II-s10i]|uniref:dipeptidase n=1 Tax=Oceanicola sp. 22II-s10i TaxID=1317116 RepID=UPI000B52855B|nr:dipeptidase [Oceanicola sp. 22II-s10i]OWU82999.1 peptidase M19 [Oceanicola sp. 22II-s10i]